MSNPAETYESYMVPVLFAPWASRLIQAANIQPDDCVLDAGCGTGIISRLISSDPKFHGKITGLDLNPDMLVVAKRLAPKIEWREGRVESLPFQNGTFDLVVCQQALQFFGDRNLALLEIRRVLKTGGRFVFSVWQEIDRHPFYEKLHKVIQKQFGMSGVETIFELGNTETSRRLLEDAGFGRIEIESISMTARFPNPEGFLAGEIDVDTAAIPSMQHLDADERHRITSEIRHEMATALQELTDEDHVVIPFHANIIRAKRS